MRVLTKEDAEQYNALLRYSFQVTEQELAETGWKDDEIKQSKFPVLDGIMKKLMKKSLTRMKESNKSFALLYPYSIPLYRRLGWEIISNKMTYVIKDTQVPQKISEPGYVRRVAWDDIDFKEMHGMFATKTHGCLYRNKLGLWEYIYKHDSMIDEVRGNNYYSEPIAFEVSDELLPWNNGTFHVEFKNGKSCLTEETAGYHLKMSIGTLTTLLMGYKTAEYLWNMGKIEGSAAAVGILDDVLLHEIPYVSDYI
ncbi:GNAT family N-acetyltransferase [bacterium]|nr:GNAT family N-acetyltransferase [bacterium]